MENLETEKVTVPKEAWKELRGDSQAKRFLFGVSKYVRVVEVHGVCGEK